MLKIVEIIFTILNFSWNYVHLPTEEKSREKAETR